MENIFDIILGKKVTNSSLLRAKRNTGIKKNNKATHRKRRRKKRRKIHVNYK